MESTTGKLTPYFSNYQDFALIDTSNSRKIIRLRYLFTELQHEKPQFMKTFAAFLSCDHVTRHKTTSLPYLKCCSVVRFPYGRGHICPPLNPYIPNLVSAPD
ncbi:hypothetical protein TcasGA2_TC010777 [Tribolium castaneum]|uniref:Uncharacterized protein n=1 Tax=Tribolium castaneum TaxID=7070 RepID=D6W7Q6_TRICA|nr:hypothetical protein TcasGA2_TC010777 [Tribolium castaneum]